ncbi:NADP-dependent alcohol dehydrogenase 6 [Psilocybe cubensis]|uniref:NADP-dependent alcohol dehydrogenase 6 n=2 Tax=Psilocybe cubensis TaxID=181762 RepID=A0ACB8GPI1_PSICU|nr:NADP-dependent alcohol dehydrogenase 6 [Psilocybe cubensis]KAH9477374.1 NADP-dependent alcohol dehydrogenase 6 [Psilocybe cubensis]
MSQNSSKLSSDIQWKGYAIENTDDWSNFKVIDFKPKPAGDYDIDIKIAYCGVCGSDVHTITGGWGAPHLPLIPGHEITGVAARVGPKVTSIKVGDRVGVGAQICSCLKCDLCKGYNEQYCPDAVDTYNGVYPDSGTVSQGGYSTAIRAHEHFVFRIPDNIKFEEASPLFCAGTTVYSPLVRHGAGPGKRVGVVGVGGLGHLALQFAKALGCADVIAFSHSPSKNEDALKMGATRVINTGEQGFESSVKGKLDLIISTVDDFGALPLQEILSTLKIGGRYIMVGLPDDNLPKMKAMDLVAKGVLLGGSKIGSRKEIVEMLKLASEKNVRPWIQVLPMKDAGKAVKALNENKVKYREVLRQDIDGKQIN